MKCARPWNSLEYPFKFPPFTARALGVAFVIAVMPGFVANAQTAASPNSITWSKVAVGQAGAQKTATLTNTGITSVTINSIGFTGTDPADFSVFKKTCGSTLAASSSCTATILFKPETTGTLTATLDFNDNSGNSPQMVPVSGVATSSSDPPGTASVSPTSISWSKVAVGQAGGQKPATLTNTGTVTVNISSINFTGTNAGDFKIFKNTCGSTLASSASCAASILFVPTAAGTRTATLNFNDDASGSPQQVSLTGLGTISGGSIAATPTSLSFGTVSIGSTSGAQTATITNGTSSSVALSSISMSGSNAADFAISSTTCGSSLAASSSCTASTTFKPSQASPETASWSITAGSTPLTVALSGTGTSGSTGTTFYVSNCGTVGSDSNSGKSPSSPWLTIAKVNSSTFSPGDSIDFDDGCTWREQLILPSAGNASNPITVGTYGSGAAPVINGSVVVTGWTAEPQTATNFTSDPNVQGYWDMTRMSGANFLDSSGNGNTLTNYNGVTQSTNTAQGSFSAAFSASSDTRLARGDTALSAGLVGKSGTTNTSATIGGWVFFNSLAPNMSFMEKGTGKVWGLYLGTGSNIDKMEWQAYLNSGYRLVASNNVMTTGTWYHVVGRINAATNEMALFINGVKQNQTYSPSSNTAISTDTAPLEVGASLSSGDFLNGNLEDIFVFNRALSDTEIASIYNSGFDGSLGTYNLYYVTGVTTTPVIVDENGLAMNNVSQKAGMTPGSWWWDPTDQRVYIRPTGDVDPSTETIEIPQRTTCITDYRNYTVITGITCQEPLQKGVYVTGANVTVQNMLIQHIRQNGPTTQNNSADGVGIYWQGSHDIIQNNTVTDTNWGIFSYAPSGQTVSNGLVQSNTVSSIGYDGIGLAVANPNGGILTNTVAQYNIVHDAGVFNLEGGAIECIFGGPTIGTGNSIRYNLVYNNGTPTRHSYPLNVQGGAGGCNFYGNLVYNNYGPCFEIASGPGNNTFYNNVCYNNGLAGNEGAGFFLTGGSADTGNTFENNIIDAGSGVGFMDMIAGTQAGNTFNNNVYFGGNSTPFIWNGTAYSLANYQSASGQDGNSINADPQFTNPSSNNFTLGSSSPAIGAGVNLGPTFQFDLAPGSTWPGNVSTANQNSNGNWDIGAYVHSQ